MPKRAAPSKKKAAPSKKKAAPSKKKAAPSKKAKVELAPFPFIGQGDAEYYEWFEMWIWFEEPVPKAQRRALLQGAPRLCTLDAQWPHPALLWASTGDQWIQQHLVEEYGTKAAKAKMSKAMQKQEEDEDFDDDDLDDLLACGGETKTFNADIERWLRAMHDKRRILFVARREDGEAGGTRLGRWHKESVAMFSERVMPALEALAKGPALAADDYRRAPIAIALEYLGGKVKPAVRKLGER
jgi:hypothetical protein